MAKAGFRAILKDFEIKSFFKRPSVCLLYKRRQNMVRTSVTLFCSYHILTSSVIYYCTDARQHGIYLLIRRTFKIVHYKNSTVCLRPQIAKANRGGRSYTLSVVKLVPVNTTER